MEEEIYVTIKVPKGIIVNSLKTLQEMVKPCIITQSKMERSLSDIVLLVGHDIRESLLGNNPQNWLVSGPEEVIKEYFKE